MKTLRILIALFFVTLPGFAGEETAPLDKDVPLAAAIEQANKRFPGIQPLTEQEVLAAAKAIKLMRPEVEQAAYETYMRIVKERVFPRGMYFSHTTDWHTFDGKYKVDWIDLRLQGRVATEQERTEVLAKTKSGIKVEGEVRVGGFGYRIRARFISVDDKPTDK